MVQLLPYGGLKWIDTNIVVTSIPDDWNIHCILEVDLEYPQNLHDLHKDLPFCPEHINPKNYEASYKINWSYEVDGLSSRLRAYIELTTELRKNAFNEFEKNLFNQAHE